MLENAWERARAGRWCGFSFILPVVVSLVCIACLVCTRVMRHCKAASLLKALRLACLCLIALVWSVCLWSNGMATQIEEVKGTASSYVFEVIGDSNPGEYGFSYTAVAKRKDGSGTTFRVRATGEKSQMRGDRFCAVGNFAALGDSDWARSRFFKGEVARLSLHKCYPAEHEVSNDVVQRARRFLLNRLNPDSTEEGSLIAGVLCGYTTELNRGSIREDFAACGLSHLIAVSGSHLAIVACLVQNVLWRCGLDSRKSRVLMLGACCFYTLLTGAAPSTIRSVCMVGCTNVSMGSGRRSHALSSLSLTLIVMLVIWAKSRIRFGISIIGVECRVDFDIRTLRVLCFARAAASIVYCRGHGHYADGPDRDASLDDVGIRSNIPLSPGGECDYRASYFTSFGFRGRCGDGPLDSWHIGFSGIASSFVLTGHSLFC